MQKSEWHRQIAGPGRQYMMPRYVYSKYDDAENIVQRIDEMLREFIHIEPAIRIIVDSPYAESERVMLAIPYESHYDEVIHRLAEMVYQSLIGYYFNADPKTNHFGISNYVLEGNFNSLLVRELEKFMTQFQRREDIAGRAVRDIEMVYESETAAGENFLKEVLIDGLDITLGFRMTIFGRQVHSNTIFIPIDVGLSVIDQVYYNLEQVIMQNFATYDEQNDTDYLKMSNTLIYKEVVSLLKRSKNKEVTRKKLLNDLKFPTSLTDDMSHLYGRLIGDTLYDTLNHVNEDRVRAARDRSRDLYNAFMIKATEITNNAVDVSKLKIGQAEHFPIKTKIELPKAETRQPATTGGRNTGDKGGGRSI